jgi:hypothetical protein
VVDATVAPEGNIPLAIFLEQARTRAADREACFDALVRAM